MGNQPPTKWDSEKPMVKSIGSGVLPANISSIVAEYLSDDNSDYVKAALIGVQPINLCLSNKAFYGNTSLASCGLVSLEDSWVPLDFKIDKQFSIAHRNACLHFLKEKNSNYCTVAIEVLTVVLNMTGNSFPNVLNDLRDTIFVLQEHLKSVKHVVIYVEYGTCLIFSLNEVIITADGVPQSVDQSEALFNIIDDLTTCWNNNSLTTLNVFAFYFQSNLQRKSEKYLAKFVCDWKKIESEVEWREKALRIPSNKILWVMYPDDYTPSFNPVGDTYRSYGVVYWDGKLFKRKCRMNGWVYCTDDVFFNKKKPFIERIFIKCSSYGDAIQLPRPSTPLTDHSRRSALIELKLEGIDNDVHLTDLSNGYFPHLRHLTVIGGITTGHLDSHRVPLLETLIVEPGRYKIGRFCSPTFYFLIRDFIRTLLRCGRPWQLVTTQAIGGFSFASYDEAIANPQDEVKENSTFSKVSPHSLPQIKELLLVGWAQQHFDEWQKQLQGFPCFQAAVKDHNDRILVWEPQCVEKISAFCIDKNTNPRLAFTAAKLDQEHIFTSLVCIDMSVDIDGVAVPCLQLLKMNGGFVKLSGTFPSLKMLSLRDSELLSPWHVDAPSLQSLRCHELLDGQKLSMTPKRLPNLSSLKIVLRKRDPRSCPVIVDDEYGWGFSGLTSIIFGKNITLCPFFDQCGFLKVSNLELTVHVSELPKCVNPSIWQCQTLTINVHALQSGYWKSQKTPIRVPIIGASMVKTFTLTETDCRVVFEVSMVCLTVLSVPTPESLISLTDCHALKRIHYTEKLSDIEKKRALDRATYEAIGARPSEIIFAADYEFHTMAWDAFPNENSVLPLGRPV